MTRIGAYYSGFQADERKQRLDDIPKMAAIGFDWLASPFSAADPNCLKAAQVCRDNGMKVLLQPNALTPAQFTNIYGTLANIDCINVQDDAHAAKPEDIAAKRDTWKPMIGSRATFITCAKGTDAKYANICPWYGTQVYTWKESNWLRKWYWDDVIRLRAAVQGRLIVHPFLGKNATPYALRDLPDWREREFTPVAQNEAAMWLALCAGADDFLFYTAYELPQVGGLAWMSGRSYILEHPIWCEQYKAVFANIRENEKHLAGKREMLPANGTILGAKWTLPDGSGLTVTVDVKSEVFPRLRFDPFQPPLPPPPPAEATVKITSDGRSVRVEQLP